MRIIDGSIGKNAVSILLDEESKLTRAYINSERGRRALAAECPALAAKVLAVWGDTPVVEDTARREKAPAGEKTPATLDILGAQVAALTLKLAALERGLQA